MHGQNHIKLLVIVGWLIASQLFNEVTSAAEVIKHQQNWEGNYVTVQSKIRKKRARDRRSLQEICSFHVVKQFGKVVGNLHAPK